MKTGILKKHKAFVPTTPNQILFTEYLSDKRAKLVVALGPSGVGKTLFSVKHATEMFLNKQIERIIITRPAIPSNDEDLGYLPGDINSKMHPWLMPIYDNFKEFMVESSLNSYIANGDIEICPLSFIRGRTFDNCIMIADEVQNTSRLGMKTLLTRMGENSKLILTGDLEQSDTAGTNGLADFMTKYYNYNQDNSLIRIVKFDKDEVVRSELVKHILQIYDF